MPEQTKGTKTSEWLDNLINKVLLFGLILLAIFAPENPAFSSALRQTIIVGALSALGVSSGMYTFSRMRVKTTKKEFNGD